MRLTKRRRTTRPDMNMTPMIDIVFLLIIFFMTVTQVSEVNKERLQLPKLKGSQDQKRTTLTINVSQDGELRVSGRTMTIAGLVGMVADELQRLQGETSRLTVVIRADQRGTSRMVNEIVAALAKLRINLIRFAVEAPR
ncbi:MAG: ExbD/TolR family protein [Pirellulaceae bacterium]